MSEIKITRDNFEEEVLNSNIPVLLDFWAVWCGPCMMLSPIIEEIANEADGKFKVGKVNVDEENELASAFKISNIPTLIVIKDGIVAEVSVGYQTKDKILSLIESVL